MNVNENTANAAASSEPPSRGAPVPNFPELHVFCAHWAEPDRIRIEYRDWPEDLIASGAVPRRALSIGCRNAARRRLDSDGARWYVRTYWRLRESPGGRTRRSRFYCVSSDRPIAQVERMPGGPEGLAAEERCRAWLEHDARIKSVRASIDRSSAAEQASRPRPVLTLIVDNTRRGAL